MSTRQLQFTLEATRLISNATLCFTQTGAVLIPGENCIKFDFKRKTQFTELAKSIEELASALSKTAWKVVCRQETDNACIIISAVALDDKYTSRLFN